MNKPQTNIKEVILLRMNRFFRIFFILAILMLARIFWIQFISPEIAFNTQRMLDDKIFKTEVIKARRGAILAHNGDPLAISIRRYQVNMDFGSEGFDSLKTFEKQSDSLARLLSAFFGDRSAKAYKNLMLSSHKECYKLKYKKDTIVPRSEKFFPNLFFSLSGERMKTVKLYDTIRSHQPVALFPRFVDYGEWQQLRKYPILNWSMGMTYHLVEDEQRIYPNGGAARRTIGSLGVDRKNDVGIEKIYDAELRGEDGLMKIQRIARGFYGRIPDGENKDAVDGLDIVTTIDIDIQDVTHKALMEQCEKHEAIWGTSIVMDVETGDILAISNLDRQKNGGYIEAQNRAIGARAEPGSTFKLFSTMALLELAQMPTSEIYDSEDGRYAKIGRKRVRDSHPGYEEVDLRTAFAQSLNVYFCKAIYEKFKDKPEVYVDMLERIGLNQGCGLELFGEPTPRLPHPDRPKQAACPWYRDITLVNLAYGYGLEMTPMQTLSFYNAIANGGQRMAPRLIKEIQREGKTIKRFPVRELGERIASQQTIDTLRSFMLEAAESGTGALHLGKFEGFEAGAKTGTAQFSQGEIKYSDRFYIGSMVGFMPADNPKYTVITALHVDAKRGKGYYGATLSGTPVKKIMQHLYNREMGWQARIDTISTRVYPTQIKGGDAESVLEVARELLPSGAISREETNEQEGETESASEADARWVRTQIDSTSQMSISQLDIKQGIMPNVYGLGLRDALFILEKQGLEVDIQGEGYVWRQSIRAGQRVKKGANVTLTLR